MNLDLSLELLQTKEILFKGKLHPQWNIVTT